MVQVSKNLIFIKFAMVSSKLNNSTMSRIWSVNKNLFNARSCNNFPQNDEYQKVAVKLIYTVLKKLNTWEITF